MTIRTVAYFTDAHLGQKVHSGGDTASNKMSYLDEPAEHRDNLKCVLNDIAEAGIREVIFGGDVGTRDSNKWFFETVGQYPFSLKLTLRNHDTFSRVRPYFHQRSVSDCELIYTEEDDFLKYIFLDTSSNSISKDQLSWLEEELSTSKNVIIFSHHPILEIDTPVDKIGGALRERESVKNRLQISKRDITIFCGHYHRDDEAIDGNIRQFTTPAVSYQLNKTAGRVTIDKQSFGCRLITISGEAVDTKIAMMQKQSAS